MKMGLGHSPSVVTSGLVFALDAGNTKSYPNTGTTWTDLSGNSNTGTLTNGPTFDSYEARTNGLYNSTSAWGVFSNATITPNSAVSPDGTTNAVTITSTGTVNAAAYIYTGQIANTIYTVSIYAKQGTSPFVYVIDWFNMASAWFNLSTGAVGSVTGSATASIVAAGSGWYRCIFTKDGTGVTPTDSRVDIGISDTAGSYSVTNGRTAYIYGVQREVGSFATSYIPTTSSPVTRSAGPATLVFDGTDDYISTSSNQNLLPAAGLSICAWIKSSVADKWGVDKAPSAGGQGYIFAGTSLSTWAMNVNGASVQSVSTYTSNTWKFIVGTWTPSSNLTIYFNGVLDAISTTSIPATITDPSVNLWIARRRSGGDYFNGSIANVSIYSVALTADQVLQNFNALRGRFGL